MTTKPRNRKPAREITLFVPSLLAEKPAFEDVVQSVTGIHAENRPSVRPRIKPLTRVSYMRAHATYYKTPERLSEDNALDMLNLAFSYIDNRVTQEQVKNYLLDYETSLHMD